MFFNNFNDFFKRNKWIITIAGSAIIIRILYLLEISVYPGFNTLMVDELWHWEWAESIINGSILGDEVFFRAPLYPYILALIKIMAGDSILWAKILQTLLTIGTSVFIYRLTGHLFGKTPAIIAGFIYVGYGTLVFYETMFLIPVLFLFLLVWGMFRLVAYRDSEKLTTCLFTGIVFGLAAVARPNILMVIPFLMLWMFFIRKHLGTITKRLIPAVVMGAGVIIAILPVTIRNAVVTGEFILISSQGGINLYLGNNNVATGLSMMMPEIQLDESITWRSFIPATNAIAEKEAGRSMSPGEISSFWSGKAVSFISANPGKFMELLGRKTLYLLSGFENSDNADIYYQRKQSGLYSILLWKKGLYFPFGLLLPLFIAGAFATRNKFKKLVPIYIFIIAYIPTIILFLVTARHRLPLIPFMIIIMSGGIVALFDYIRERALKEIIISILLLILSLIAFNRTFFHAGQSSDFQIHYNNGLKFDREGDYASAEKEYLLADNEYPYSAPLLNLLGYSQFNQEKYGLAEKNYLRAIKVNPGYPLTYNNLGEILKNRENYDSAIVLYNKAVGLFDTTRIAPEKLGQVFLNLGETYEARGDLDSAAMSFLAASKVAPAMGIAYFRGAGFFARIGRYHHSDSLYMAGKRVGELRSMDNFNWGLSMMERKQYSTAIGLFFQALKLDRTLHQAYYLIAVGYYENNMPDDSVYRYIDLCLNYAPDFEPAHFLKKKVGEKNK